MAPAGSHLFVSYASIDRDRVLPIAEALEATGLNVWIDRQGIPGGVSYGPEIVSAIRESAALVLCCSPAAFASRNIRQEVALAWTHGRPILPLLLEVTAIPDELAYWLEAAQWVELLDLPEEAWLPHVLGALRRLGVEAHPAAAMQPAAPPDTNSAPLPTPLTELLGRDSEVQEVADLLATQRLVTLTGPGGVGKTRLAIEVAQNAAPTFPDGVAFVDLSALWDSDLVLPTIAQTLGVREHAGRPLADALVAALGDRRLLVVLDNFEQVREAGPAVTVLLSTCARLVVLATSRVSFAVRGERVVPVEPLAVPSAASGMSANDLAASPAVALFAERAAGVRPGFRLNEENTATVAEICARLDGLPLAIELAAARLKLLSPDALLARLAQTLPTLIDGPRDLPERQQTLRATIAWSYDLLAPAEQELFRRLSVFAGGWTLEAAEAVAGGPERDGVGLDVFEGLGRLVDRSLVREEEGPDGEPRFGMLETLREFGLEQLEASGEAEAARRTHAAHYLDLAEQAEPELTGPRQVAWFDRLEAEHTNLRAALEWACAHREAEVGLRLAGALGRYLDHHSHLREGRRWLEATLALAEAEPASLRAKALHAVGVLALEQGDYDWSERYLGESLALSRAAGDGLRVGFALNGLGSVALYRNEYARAAALHEEGLGQLREVGDRDGIAALLGNLGYGALLRGDYAGAIPYCEESLALYRGIGSKVGSSNMLVMLGRAVLAQGDPMRATELLREGLSLNREVGNQWYVAQCLDGLAGAAVQLEQPERAARLFGAAETLREAIGVGLPLFVRTTNERYMAAIREQLDAPELAAAWEQGRALPLDQTIADELGVNA